MEVRSLRDLLSRALTAPGRPCYLLLSFKPGDDEIEDWSYFWQALPWLQELGSRHGTLCEDLRQHGLGVVACADEAEAERLCEAVRVDRLSVKLYKPQPRPVSPELRRLRRRHGLYATPPALAGYLVRSVDDLLRTKLGWSAGLADSRVRLLDPAAGSMNFLRAAWRLALSTHGQQGGATGDLFREHLLPHSLGVELLPEVHARGLANLRRFLRACGHAADAEQLPGVLGDALAPAAEILDFPANVVLGNPPWRGRSDSRGEWIMGLLASYSEVDGRPLGERNPKWLQDDAVKFLRLAQWKIDEAGEGIVALVLPHTGLDAPTFRGLRRSLLHSFDEIYALDLHGNQRKREKRPGGGADENVFSGVAQGVSLLVLVKQPGLPKRILRADLYGSRRDKLAVLAASHAGTTRWEEVRPKAPYYRFVQGDERSEREYGRGLALPEIFPRFTTGVITGRDGLVTDPDRRVLVERLSAICRAGGEVPGLDPAWREELCRDAEWPGRIRSFLAGPFDRRFLLYINSLLERPRRAVMAHMEKEDNLALLASRQSRGEPGALVTRWIAGHKAASAYDVSSVFPLYLDPQGETGGAPPSRVPNLAPDLLAHLAERYGALPRPEKILAYVYAVLHDSYYRKRFRQFLRGDFPRIPFPRERGLFQGRAALGAELIGLHLLTDPRLAEPPDRRIGDATQPLGSGRRAYILYEEGKGRLTVNRQGLAFEGIAPEVFRYEVGDHRVLARWLRGRTGRVLRPEEILTFRRIVAALALTLEVQARIAEVGTGRRKTE